MHPTNYIFEGVIQKRWTYTQSLHTFLSIFNRENKSWARLLYKSFLQKNYFFFVYFHSFQTFLKEFSLTRAGPNFEFASKFFFLQTKYKITRHTRIFTCDMPIALILRPKEAEVFFVKITNSIQNCWEISIFQTFLIQIRTSRYYFDKFFGF